MAGNFSWIINTCHSAAGVEYLTRDYKWANYNQALVFDVKSK